MAADELYSDVVFEDLEPKSVDVWITSKKPAPPSHRLREATEDAACRYRNVAIRSMRMKDNVVTGMEGTADCQPVLVAGCLFRLGPDPKKPTETRETAVTVPEVRAMPTRVVKTLFDRAKAMSGIDEGEDTDESLTKQIDALVLRREKVRAGKSGPKAPPPGTGDTSDSVGNSGEPSADSSAGRAVGAATV